MRLHDNRTLFAKKVRKWRKFGYLCDFYAKKYENMTKIARFQPGQVKWGFEISQKIIHIWKNIFGVLQFLPDKMSLFITILKAYKPQNWCVTSFLHFMCPKHVICCYTLVFIIRKNWKNTLSAARQNSVLCVIPPKYFFILLCDF